MAYVEDLNGPWLFESMYAEDPEASKLAALPGMQELLAAYPLQVQSVKNTGLRSGYPRDHTCIWVGCKCRDMGDWDIDQVTT